MGRRKLEEIIKEDGNFVKASDHSVVEPTAIGEMIDGRFAYTKTIYEFVRKAAKKYGYWDEANAYFVHNECGTKDEILVEIQLYRI